MPICVGDLGLRESFEEPKVDDLLLAFGEHREHLADGHPVVDRDELRVDLAERCAGLDDRLVVGAAGVDRRQPVQAAGLHALEHVFLEHAGTLCDLRRRRRTTELLAEIVDGAVELEVQLLDAARHAHRPTRGRGSSA